MANFHINNDDEIKRCSAKEGNCRFGDVEHFASSKDAETFLEQKFENTYGSLSTVSAKKKGRKEPDLVSADISKNYSHISILENHLHNAGDTGNDLELYYYNSPAGRQDLQYRIGMDETDRYAKDYLEIRDKIDDPDFDSSAVELHMKNAEESIASKIQDGAALVNNDFGQGYEILSAKTAENDSHDDEIRHYLVDQSYKWYSQLSTDEQTAVGSLTSNSFLRLQYSLGYENKKYPPNHVFKDYVDIDGIENNAYDNGADPKEALNKEFKKNADELKNNVMNSFKKAPLLSEPVMTYRGTSINEVRELLGVYDGEEYDRYKDDHIEPTNNLVNDLLSGKYNGQSIDPKSRLRNIPVSTTVSPNRAKSFGQGEVYLEIKRRTSTSPVLNGAWGSTEQEILSNPLNNYRIVGAMETDHEFGKRKGVILQLEEIVE